LLVFVDESGDPGMNVARGASEPFVVALVSFKGPVEAQQCDDAIAEHRRSVGLPASFEFHFSKNSRRQREAFLEVISESDFQTYVFDLNKRAASELGFNTKEVCNWTTKKTFENAREFLSDARVVIDGSGDRQFRRQLTAYLRQEINEPSEARIIRDVRIQPSHQNSLLQVADYVASISARALTAKADAERLRRMYFGSREGSFGIWPL